MLIISTTIQVSKLAKAWPPVAEVVVVLVATAGGGVQGAEGASSGATALIVKHQQGVVRGRCRVVVCCLQAL